MDSLEEFGALLERWAEEQRRLDLRAGIIATILANANRNKKKKSTPFRIEDFFPSLEVHHEDDWKILKAMFEARVAQDEAKRDHVNRTRRKPKRKNKR